MADKEVILKSCLVDGMPIEDFQIFLRHNKRGLLILEYDDLIAAVNRFLINGDITDFVTDNGDEPINEKTNNGGNRGKTHVYLIKNNRNGYIKIGRSKSILQRERTLQAEDPDLSLIYTSPPCFTRKELELQSFFNSKRIRGEWFALDDSDVESVKQHFKTLSNTNPLNNRSHDLQPVH